MADIRYRIHQDVISGLFYANLLHPSQVYGQGKTAAEAVTSLKIALNVRKGVQQ
jgi:predicted RNase H-like HicB family nuclease